MTVTQQDGQPLPEFPVEWMEITPLEGGLLSSIEAQRYKTTLEESRALILPYLAKAGRTPQELDRFLAAVKADYLDYDGMSRGVKNFGASWSEPKGPRYVVGFRKAFDPNRPLIMIMALDWANIRTPRQQSSFYHEPIPPPPGYEQESMQAPKKFGPDSQADINLAKGIPITGDRPPSMLPAPTTGQWRWVAALAFTTHRAAGWLHLARGILLLILIALFLRRRSQ